jgi:hypothetical protein
MQARRRNPARATAVVALVLVSMFAGAGFSTARAAAAATAAAAGSPIDQAQKLYDAAKFTEAVTTLRSALATGQVTGSNVVAARALLARALVKTGDRLEARQAFQTVLRMDPAYRPDAVVVPPDEMDVFNLALQAVTAEQIEAGKRIPASLGFFYGTGSGSNKDLGKVVAGGGGPDHLSSKPEFGVAVRFPLRPKLSLDLEIMRLRATAADTGSSFYRKTTYEVTSIPLVVNLYYTLLSGSKTRLSAFVGGGPMAASRMAFTLDQRTTPELVFTLGDERVGTYLNAGGEGEYLLSPRLSVTGRALVRGASAKDFFKKFNVDLYDNGVTVQNRKLDFGGFAAFIGLRAYIGY